MPDAPVTQIPLSQRARLHQAAVSPVRLWRHGSRREKTFIFAGWLLSLVLSVLLGMLSVLDNWSGLSLTLGGVDIYITVYPPLLVAVFWALCFGWWWGAVPAWISTMTLALYAGMSPGWAALFACADPLGIGVMVMGYRAITTLRQLRGFDSLLYFTMLSFVSSIFGSSGALIWCYNQHLAAAQSLPIWQGWWVGFFLQNLLLAGPLIWLAWPRLERWYRHRPELMRPDERDSRRLMLLLLALVTLGVLVYGFATLYLGSGKLSAISLSALPAALANAVMVMNQTAWVFFWVFGLLVVFNALFGYRLFLHWQGINDRLMAELKSANASLEALARLDGLTGLLNRRAGDAEINLAWQRSRRYRQSASVIMLDIDHFKRVNDRYGHDAGDAVIMMVARVIQSTLRVGDVAIRYGGEEFLLVLPQTGGDGAAQLAERLRQLIAQGPTVYCGLTIPVTISLGVAELTGGDVSREDWVRRADKALYLAKRGGRDRVELHR